MKAFACLALAASTGVGAFPWLLEAKSPSPSVNEGPFAASKARRQASSSTAPTFSASDQLISTSGLYEFVAPGPLDARGPCPGLNAMANHGYLPHIGVATLPQFALACEQVFRMGSDLATILAAYGSAIDGPAAGWSIGGSPHIGIGGSHGNYETDSSPMRGDLNQYGSNTGLVMSQFYELYNLQPDASTANYDISVLRTFRENRYQDSINKNPDFYYAPFAGAVVSQAAFSFIYRFMANKTAEQPEGILNKNVLKSFFSISGSDEQNLVWTPGHERIPDNWYTRNSKDTYGIDQLSDDIDYLTANNPAIGQPGCNMGRVNSYTPINTTAMSGGAYSQQDVIEHPLCFGLAYSIATIDQVSGVVNDVYQEAVLPVQNALGCITAPEFNTTVGKACPGYSFFGGPTGPVAPGAVQS